MAQAPDSQQQGLSSFNSVTSQSSVQSSAFGPVLPLTKKNLRSLNSTNSNIPFSPTKNLTSTVDSLKQKDVTDVRKVLKHNGYLINDDEAYDSYPIVASAVESVLGRERSSTMKPEVQKALATTLRDFQTAHKTTFMVNFMTKVLAGGRKVPSVDIPSVLPTQEELAWMTQDWEAERLRIGWLAPMRKNCIPRIQTDDGAMNILLKKFPKVSDPVPDMIFGMYANAFDGVDEMINDAFFMYSQVAKESLHSFCILEAKSDAGEAGDAVNQACRGGAALVLARMMFDSKTRLGTTTTAKAKGKPDLTKILNPDNTASADPTSIAFSIILTPMLAHVYVHWAERRVDNATIFHMTLVKAHALEMPGGRAIQEFRRDLCSILDWGLLKRKQELKTVMASIASNLASQGTPIRADVFDEVDLDTDDEDEVAGNDSDGERPGKKRARK